MQKSTKKYKYLEYINEKEKEANRMFSGSGWRMGSGCNFWMMAKLANDDKYDLMLLKCQINTNTDNKGFSTKCVEMVFNY